MFANRREAGRLLAAALSYRPAADVVVLGLPRGGVPVAREVARELGAPLDVCLVRKLGAPTRPELAMGAVGEGGVTVLNDDVLVRAGVAPDAVDAAVERERAVIDDRARAYRRTRPQVDLTGRTVVVVDDGIATGATARAACQVARAHGADRVVLAAPVAPRGWEEAVGDVADECVCLSTPQYFGAIGRFYDDFAQTDDAEVLSALAEDAEPTGPAGGGDGDGRGARATTPGEEPASGSVWDADPVVHGDGLPDAAPLTETEIEVRAGRVTLPATLTLPPGTRAVVLFAHGSGSGRLSPRNRFVARVLQEAGLGTLLFDMLSPQEAAERENVFDVGLLASRLAAAKRRLREDAHTRELDLGLFGASTGAAAALAAAGEGSGVSAVVSRGGRPDLAASVLPLVQAPTLFIVGGHDPAVLDLNRQAQALLRAPNDLAVVPGATHLFEEPGTLEAASRLARDWFLGHLATSGT